MIIADFHSHILPQMDDGSHSVAESVQMLKAGQEQGIDRIVATPHFYPHNEHPESFLTRRARAAEAFEKEIGEKHSQIYLGAEVYYYPGMSESTALKDLTIDGGRFILIEMPMTSWSDQMLRELEGIYTYQGLIPIIAHIDRYLGYQHNRKVLKWLGEMPVLVQANAGFFLNKRTSRMAIRMLRRRQIHLLGSDCHNLQDRPQNLGKAIEYIAEKLGKDVLKRIEYYQSRVLEGGL